MTLRSSVSTGCSRRECVSIPDHGDQYPAKCYCPSRSHVSSDVSPVEEQSSTWMLTGDEGDEDEKNDSSAIVAEL